MHIKAQDLCFLSVVQLYDGAPKVPNFRPSSKLFQTNQLCNWPVTNKINEQLAKFGMPYIQILTIVLNVYLLGNSRLFLTFSIKVALKSQTGQRQKNFNFGPSLLKF